MEPYRAEADVGVRRTELTLPPSEVTVLEDRAVVTRRARVELAKGSSRIVISGASPVAIDKSLIAELSGSSARVGDARVERRAVRESGDGPADQQSLDDDVELAKERLDRVVEARLVLAAEADGLVHALALFLAELAEDAANGRSPAGPEAEVAELVERERELRRELARLGVDENVARQQFDRRVERRAAGMQPTQKHTAEIVISVTAEEAGVAELVVRYVVANACWRPRHRLTLDDDGRTLSVESRATVWQNTGERWPAVKLTLSTERPSLGTKPPTLETEWLSATRKGALVVETREQKIEQASQGEAQKKIVDEMPGIDDGGAPQRLVAATPTTVESDGRPHSTGLFSATSPAEITLVATPELQLAAMTRVSASNNAPHPLLAGPVELIRSGGVVGRSKIDFVAAGERFTIGFGPDPDIAVHREIAAVKDESSLLGSWQTKTHDVELKLSNLGDAPKKVSVEERVLVSEIEKVVVRVVPEKSTNGVQPDQNGFVRWLFEIPPNGRQLVVLRVQIKRHSDVVG